MAAVVMTVADFAAWDTGIPAGKLQAMIDDAMATAARHAPCILGDSLSAESVAFAKALLRGAILRWAESGAGPGSSPPARGSSVGDVRGALLHIGDAAVPLRDVLRP